MAREESRLAGIRRTLRLVEELRLGREHDRNSAADLLGVQPAAADRQLAAIAEVLSGVRRLKRGNIRRYGLNPAPKTESPTTIPAAIASCIGSSIAVLFDKTPYGEGMRQSTKRLLSGVRRATGFDSFERKFVFHAQGGERALPDAQAGLDDLLDAVLESTWVRFAYNHFAGSPDRVTVKPLSLVVYGHQLYVIGEDNHGRRHPYRFARMTKVTRLKKAFHYPTRASYDPGRLWRDSLGVFLDDRYRVERIRVRLAARWRAYVEAHRWHDSQESSDDTEGVVVQLRVRVCPELEAWILGFGEEAEVLEPADLRTRIAARLANAAGRYASGVAT